MTRPPDARSGDDRCIEVVRPAFPGSAVSGFLEKRGGGLHHLTWRIGDLATALERLTATGGEPSRLVEDSNPSS